MIKGITIRIESVTIKIAAVFAILGIVVGVLAIWSRESLGGAVVALLSALVGILASEYVVRSTSKDDAINAFAKIPEIQSHKEHFSRLLGDAPFKQAYIGLIAGIVLFPISVASGMHIGRSCIAVVPKSHRLPNPLCEFECPLTIEDMQTIVTNKIFFEKIGMPQDHFAEIVELWKASKANNPNGVLPDFREAIGSEPFSDGKTLSQ
jgi:hypothetical protein